MSLKSNPFNGAQLEECLGPPYTFMGLCSTQAEMQSAKIVIVPVPYDATTTFRAGTREGPRAILQASRELEFYDEETRSEVYRQGIVTLDELAVTVASPRKMIERVGTVGHFVLEQSKFPVMLGGEHLLSVGMVQAAKAHFGDLTVLQLDAHADLRRSYQNSAYSNACVMRLIREQAPIVQVGIRSLTREEDEFIRAEGIPCFYAHDLWNRPHSWDDVVSHLGSHVYITMDLDVLDPSIMPAVGTPEPGGLEWYQILSLLRRVSEHSTVVGFDVMELLPIPHNVAPDFLAARLVYKFLSYIFMDKPRAA